MTRIQFVVCLVAATAVPGFWSANALAQHGFEVVTGKAFDSAVPKDFYLEGNAIPTQKRNASLVKTPVGARALFALIDTAGYSADIVAKYIGMIITEGDLTICGQKVTVGSYGFGWARPGTGVDQPGKFSLYNQAGGAVAGTAESHANAPRRGPTRRSSAGRVLPDPCFPTPARRGASRPDAHYRPWPRPGRSPPRRSCSSGPRSRPAPRQQASPGPGRPK